MKQVLDFIATLVRDTKRGRRDAFNDLVVKYQDQLFSTIYRMVGDFHEAKDIAQEAFLKAYAAIRDFREESAFYTWLFRIAVNTVLSRRRKETRGGRSVPLEAADEVAAPGGAPGPRPAEDPAEAVQNTERRRLVQEALGALDETDRAVLVLRDIQGFSYEEAAEIMNVPLGTVKSRIARARCALKEKLEGVI